MDLPRDQLFPSATLSADQYGRRRGRHLPDKREDLLHRRGSSYQVPEDSAKAQVAFQLVGFLETSFVADGAFQKDFEGARFHRLLQVPECLKVMDGGKRFFQTAEAGEGDRRSEVAPFVEVAEQFKA